jgi:hypothetical protein
MQALTKIRICIWIIIIGLVFSGMTAFPLESELTIMKEQLSATSLLGNWIGKIYFAVQKTNTQFPELSYGTDWLAFAHLVIAVVLIGPLNDPVKNIWVIHFGMIACVMIFPLAFIAGSIRGIPFFWQLIDCSFGVVGFIPLYISNKCIKQLLQNIHQNDRIIS